MDVTGTTSALAHDESRELTLLRVLSNPLILYHTVPLLPISSLLALGAACRDLRDLVYHTPQVFRYLDLSHVKSLHFEILRSYNPDEVQLSTADVTENNFHSGSLQQAFCSLSRRHVLQDVQILILDGLPITTEVVTEIILAPRYNVRLLSIREAQNLNEPKLMQSLEYTVRPGRTTSTPRLQGLYIFGKKDAPPSRVSRRTDWSTLTRRVQNYHPFGGVTSAQGAQLGAQLSHRSREALSESVIHEPTHLHRPGVMLEGTPTRGWAETMLVCRGLISFDAVLCTGPRHTAVFDSEINNSDQKLWYTRDEFHLSPAIATISLHGCETCHAAPEGVASSRDSAGERFPLLAPPPLYSPTVRTAKRLSRARSSRKLHLLARCSQCLTGRYCESCRKWWCENCYEIPNGFPTNPAFRQSSHIEGQVSESGTKTLKAGTWRECLGCGFNCADCTRFTQRRCKLCSGGYCIIHNEGSNMINCDSVRAYIVCETWGSQLLFPLQTSKGVDFLRRQKTRSKHKPLEQTSSYGL